MVPSGAELFKLHRRIETAALACSGFAAKERRFPLILAAEGFLLADGCVVEMPFSAQGLQWTAWVNSGGPSRFSGGTQDVPGSGGAVEW